MGSVQCFVRVSCDVCIFMTMWMQFALWANLNLHHHSSSLSSNSTKLFSEETRTIIAVPQRLVFNHWTSINITLIYWTKPYEVWRSTFSFLNKCFPIGGMVEQKAQDTLLDLGLTQNQIVKTSKVNISSVLLSSLQYSGSIFNAYVILRICWDDRQMVNISVTMPTAVCVCVLDFRE